MAHGWTGYADSVADASYWSAWDLGRKRDATCGITVRHDCEPYQVVAFETERGLPWVEVQDRIEARHRAYEGGRTAVEVTGVGDVVAGNLAVYVTAWQASERSKAQALQAARLLVERGHIKCGEPRLLRTLRDATWGDAHHADELMAFVIACAHVPMPSREVVVPWEGPPIALPMEWWEPWIRRPNSALLRMSRTRRWGW
jgi:hypothetical protein